MELDEVRRNYDRAARFYDLFTDLFEALIGGRRLRARTIDLLGPVEGATVLDIGCGTGRNFPLLVSRVGPDGQLLGFDYSEGMLGRANGRVQAEGWSNVKLVRGDAASLEGVPRVDAVVSVWCMGIVHDLDAALHQMLAVLRPGGRLVIMDFCRARPDSGLLRWLYPLYSFFLRLTGIDTAADLEDSNLRARWEGGRQILRAGLCEIREETYLQGTGMILWGRKAG